MNKLQKTARTLDTFFTVTYRIALAANIIGLVLILFTLYLCLGAPELFGTIADGMILKLDFGGIAFQVAEGVPSQGSAGTVYFLSGLILGLLGLPLYILMIRNIRRILAPMKEGLPFSAEVARGFKNLGWLSICHGILELFSSYFVYGSIARAYDLNELFLSDKITSVTTYYNFDFTFVIAALILFGLSYIFHYGTELQQLSDETL